MMPGRGTTVGLCLLCALIVSACAAQAASAVSQTAVECTESGTPVNTDRFSDAHCKSLGTAQPYFHAAIPANKSISAEATNTTTGVAWEPAFLKSTIAGLELTIEAKLVTFGTGTFENKEVGGEMYAEGLASAVHIAELSTPGRPCVVNGVPPSHMGPNTPGTLLTQPVRGTTLGQAAGTIKFEPQTGNELAEFTITGASCPAALQGSYPVFGTITSNKTEGATVPFTHKSVTLAKSLHLKTATGPITGFEARITGKAGGKAPIALT